MKKKIKNGKIYKKIRLNSLLSNLTLRELKIITKLIVNWCFDHLGENKRLKYNELEIDLDFSTEETDYAEYDYEDYCRTIRIFVNNNKNIKDLIQSLLHEYCHFLQPVASKYDKLLEEYKYYSKHPFEIEANKISEKYGRVCWDSIKNNL